MAESLADVRDAVARELESGLGHACTIAAVAELTGGESSTCYRVDLANPQPDLPRRLVLRLLHDDAATQREVLLQRAAVAAGFPAPRVVHSGTTASAFGRPFNLSEFIDGRDPIAAGALRTIPRLLAQTMHRLHACPSGQLRTEGENPLDELARVTSPEIRIAIERLRERRVFDHAGVLCHGDLHARNLLVRDGAVVGVIDWELAAIAPREYDITRTELLFLMMPGVGAPVLRPLLRLLGRRGARQFVEAYRSLHPINGQAIAFFRAFHVLRLIAITRDPSLTSPGAARLWQGRERELSRRWTELTGTPI